jgi:hypothetical protein
MGSSCVFIQVGVPVRRTDFLDENLELREGWEHLLDWTMPPPPLDEEEATWRKNEEDEWIRVRMGGLTWDRKSVGVRPIYVHDEEFNFGAYSYMIGCVYKTVRWIEQIDPAKLVEMMAEAKKHASAMGIDKDVFCTVAVDKY